MMKTCPIITIDGPSGTGKGTMAKLVAKELDWNLLDSGTLYRVLALAAKQHAVDLDNEVALQVLAAHLDVQFRVSSTEEGVRIILEGEDVTDAVRTEECGEQASRIAALGGVRKALLDRQRAFCQDPGLVADGRDMGTVVFPNAFLKVYLNATEEERAKRRYEQLKDRGISASLDQIRQELRARDHRDKQREIAPLRPADDAMVLDTTDMRIEQVLHQILSEARVRLEGISA